MKTMIVKLSFFFIALGFFTVSDALAIDYKASLANIPGYADSPEKGFLVDFTKAIAKTSGKEVSIEVSPFARSRHSKSRLQILIWFPLQQKK